MRPETSPGSDLDAELLLAMYRHMVRARVLDERMWVLNRQGRAPFVISCQGHEAAQVGIAMALRNELADTEVGISVLCPGMSATRIVETTQRLRPGASEQGAAAQTAQNMTSVLAAGMSPDKIGQRVVRAIERDEFFIFTHEEPRTWIEERHARILAGFDSIARYNASEPAT